ncbi:hypothetical protein [Streptomyces turgidiscabies]|uniref:Uncharacterized protein n=1 Tax=Streptomyces turgidiscabies TaxID=85558 RepID=A0ABU0RYC9_9ACTN|nr:hypothetical protein [Streptomyces turgidiscabies]MDQ0936167.1 hypothetical protein [Streptomyces turgidiscabies]
MTSGQGDASEQEFVEGVVELPAEVCGVGRLENRSRPQALPVPSALADTARSVTVLPIPRPGARDRSS